MAAFCGLIQNFIACSDNGLAQRRAFFSVSFRDILYISALSSRLRHARSLYFTEILWPIFILDIGDVLPVLYFTFSNALIYQIHPFKLNKLLHLLRIGLNVSPHVAKFFYSRSHTNILATFSGYINRIFRIVSQLKMSKLIILLMISKSVIFRHKNSPNLSEGALS